MTAADLLHLYENDPEIQTIASRLGARAEGKTGSRLHLKGLVGSQDAVVVAALHHRHPDRHFVLILHDKDEATYFASDLQHLLAPGQEVLLFPASYKRAYAPDETENANVLMRAEVLNRVSSLSPGSVPKGEGSLTAAATPPLPERSGGQLIVTYPEALSEKVINRQSLIANTFSCKVGEKLDVNFLTELLTEYDFERADFVYEPGQFAVRGGIVDVFGYANDLPYRVELFGNEIESIRTFDPESQLSVEIRDRMSIVPNVQTRLLTERRESLFEFLPAAQTILFAKDIRQTLDVVDEQFERAETAFRALVPEGGIQISSDPETLFDTQKSLKKHFDRFPVVEFGKRFHYQKEAETFGFTAKVQPSFNKDFGRLVKHLHEAQAKRLTPVIAADSMRQIDRLRTIFDELDHDVRFQHLTVALREGFVDEDRRLLLYTDHQLFERFYRAEEKKKFSKKKAMTLKELQTLQPGDYVVHQDNGIARFAGLTKIEIGDRVQESVRLVFRDDDIQTIPIHSLHKISKYSGAEGGPPQLSKLGSPEWENRKKAVKKKVKDIAAELIRLYAKRKTAPGYAYTPDSFLQAELESSFLYEDTPDQAKATEDVKHDMQLPHPMDRLVCGDVGFGKTEIAIRAAFKAAADGKQVAVLVPTTILAMQHFKTFRDRLAPFPVTVDYVNRFKTAKQTNETYARVAAGKVDILIGTHALTNKKIKFKDLGLLIIDEEQKFGVKTKDKLKEIKVNVDTLTLTATPIPRTLHFSLMGARDLSVIATPPPNRQPVTTELHVFEEALIRDAVAREIKRGGQVFFVHNRIADIDEMANLVLRLVPDARVTYAHGQMDGEKLEKRMMQFVDHEFDVLVSTNIIESGLDIPNANTIIINRAHMFGLSDLHQMRGRVGRSNKKAYCLLLTPPVAGLPSDARKRLSTLEEFSDLGDGFKVAMRDLDIRGAGNLLGGEQSGFINDLGFETYHQILDEAVQELKETDFKELFMGTEADKLAEIARKNQSRECQIETDLQLLIPDTYVQSVSERLQLYARLDRAKNEAELGAILTSIEDRFGPLPAEVTLLADVVRLRWLGCQVGFQRLTLKRDTLKGYLPAGAAHQEFFQGEGFGQILNYVQTHPRTAALKDRKEQLIVSVQEVPSLHRAMTVLREMGAAVPAI